MNIASDALALLNSYRASHQACPLTVDDTLTSYAQNWANRLEFVHSNGPYGECLALDGGTSESDALLAAVNMWYAEGSAYDYNTPVFSMNTGHFTCVCWKSTTKVGFGIAKMVSGSYAGDWLVVASFDPPGNVEGSFAENVLPASGDGRVTNGTQPQPNLIPAPVSPQNQIIPNDVTTVSSFSPQDFVQNFMNSINH